MIATLEEAKLFLRIDNSDEDTLITDLLKHRKTYVRILLD